MTHFAGFKNDEARRVAVQCPCFAVALIGFFPYAGGMELLTAEEIGRLTPPERLALIAQLWDSLNHEQVPLTGPQRVELDRRLGSLDDDHCKGVTWSALTAELEQRCP